MTAPRARRSGGAGRLGARRGRDACGRRDASARMRRIAVALAVVAALAGEAAAEHKIQVLQSDGRADAKVRAKIDASIIALARTTGDRVVPGDITFSEAAAAVGCRPEEAACRDEVLGMLSVDELVVTTVTPKPGGFEVAVRRVARGAPPREATSFVASDRLDRLDAIAILFATAPAGAGAPAPATTAGPPASPTAPRDGGPPRAGAPTTVAPPAPREGTPPRDAPSTAVPPDDRPAPREPRAATAPAAAGAAGASAGTGAITATTSAATSAGAGAESTPGAASTTTDPTAPAPAAYPPPAMPIYERDREVDQGNRRLQLAGVIGGGAAVIAGLIAWGAAAGTQGEVDAAPTATQAQLLELRELEQRGEREAFVGNILVLTGLVVGGVSTYFYVKGGRRARSARLTPAVFDRGGGLAIGGSL